MTSVPDRYDIEARYVPALVCSVPFAFLGFYYLSGIDQAFWQSAFTLTAGSVTLSAALFVTAIHFCRTIGKMIEVNLFRNGLQFPTTNFLLDKDANLTPDRKSKIRKKVLTSFDVDLTNATEDTEHDRRLIHEAVGHVRKSLYKKSPLVMQRNIQFGLTRNLLSGSLIASVVSAFGLALSNATHNAAAGNLAAVLLACYLLIGISSALLLRFSARQYVYALYDEFLAS